MARTGLTDTRPGAAFWAIAGLSLLWNGFACLDFAMTMARDTAYLAPVPPEAIDWLDASPSWTILPWGLGAGAALAGSLLLLARSRWAVTAFALSLAGLAASQAWQLTTGLPASMTTPGMTVMRVMAWIVAVGLAWYAAANRRTGTLR